MARKTIIVCDGCEKEIEEKKGATLRVTFDDARKGSIVAEVCADCAGKMPGRPQARRGRRPATA